MGISNIFFGISRYFPGFWVVWVSPQRFLRKHRSPQDNPEASARGGGGG
jgi:hypothetical protein